MMATGTIGRNKSLNDALIIFVSINANYILADVGASFFLKFTGLDFV
jgi:hypothetical protein